MREQSTKRQRERWATNPLWLFSFNHHASTRGKQASRGYAHNIQPRECVTCCCVCVDCTRGTKQALPLFDVDVEADLCQPGRLFSDITARIQEAGEPASATCNVSSHTLGHVITDLSHGFASPQTHPLTDLHGFTVSLSNHTGRGGTRARPRPRLRRNEVCERDET